jgi:hypothetical protein
MDNPHDKQTELFMGLVVSFQVSALQFMGKLVNPMTGQSERDLPSAAASIDMLDMLYAKTKGNLTPEEAKMLEETLSHLKLNYVAEVNRPTPPPEPEKPDISADKVDSSEPPKG